MRKWIIAACAVVLAGLIVTPILFWQPKEEMAACEIDIPIIPSSDSPHVGTMTLGDGMSVRLIILKHCFDSIADSDADQAIEAVDMAKTKGMNIRLVGEHYIKKEGKVDRMQWTTVCKMSNLQEFVSEQMKIDAEPNDTFIIYTIGHGSKGGSLQYIGERTILSDAFSNAAEENEQETIWWQLSCYAASGLPDISSMNEAKQEYFSMLASSEASSVSYFHSQGKFFNGVFNAIANRDKAIDPNEDMVITAKEFRSFLNTIEPGHGSLFFAASDEEPIFGYNLANAIPIENMLEPPKEYPKDYIPIPKRGESGIGRSL